MTTLQMAVSAILVKPQEQRTEIQRKQSWPWPVLAALMLHGAAFVLILSASLAPRQIPIFAGEALPITLYAAPPAPMAAALQAAPARQTPEADITPVKPQPAPEKQVVPQPVKPVSIAKNRKSVAKARKEVTNVAADKPAAPAATAPPSQPAANEHSTQPATQNAISTAAVGTQGGSGHAVIPARPRYQDNPPPNYPELARRRQIQGTVILEALVNGRGRVDDLNVHATSGYNLLDDAALRAVRNWLFVPGKRGGVPMDMKVLVPVRFALR